MCDSIVSKKKLNEDKRLKHEIDCHKETVKLDNIDVYWVSTRLQVANVFTKDGAPTNLILELLETRVLRFKIYKMEIFKEFLTLIDLSLIIV